MKTLLKYLKGYEKETIIAPLFKMLEACFELFVPIVTARIIDIGIKNNNKHFIWMQCIILIALGLIGLVCALIAQYYAAKAGMGFGANLRKDLFAHINQLNYEELDSAGTPTLVTRITSDVNQIQTGVNLFLRLFMRSPFLVIGATVMALTISPKLTLIFLVALPLIALTIYLIVRYTVPKFKKVQMYLDRVVLHTRENYTGVRVVRAFHRQQEEKKDFEETNSKLMKEQIGSGKISSLMNPVTYAIANLAIVALLVGGGFEVQNGALTQGEVVALTNYMTQVLLSLLVLANLIISVSKASASAIRVNEVFAIKPVMTEGTNSYFGPETKGDMVAFHHISFRYSDESEDVLSNIDVTIKQGETIGIIGGTGSGKTTLIQLIPRFYDVKSGTVEVAGQPVTSYQYKSLRSHIGIVPQRSVLFSGTIRDNMQWGKRDATDSEIWEALQIAQASDFVSKKQGALDANVTAGGSNFSGGQRQRLCIARALVGKPDILILDDSSSALDYATDAALRLSIRKNIETCTTFLVSQRVATVLEADQILVMDDGKLVGTGTHDELLKNNEIYKEICISQNMQGVI